MFVIPSLFILFATYAVQVDSVPQNDLGFPDEAGAIPDYGPEPAPDEELGNRQGFRPVQSSRPRPRPANNFRPPGGNSGPTRLPGNNFGSGIPSSGFRPQGSQSGNNFGTTGLRPGNEFRPTNSRPVNNLRPNTNSQNGIDFRPTTQRVNNFQNSRPGQVQTSTSRPSSTTSSSASTTTRIPPRDPTNRIVYTVSCPCQYTRQYAPVCGTDGQTYGNIGVLHCAQECGSNVQVFLMGACVRSNG